MINETELDEELDEEVEAVDTLKEMVQTLDELPTDVLKQLLQNLEEIEEYNKTHPYDEDEEDEE